MSDDTESRRVFEKWIAVRFPSTMDRWPDEALARMTGKAGIYVDRFIQLAWEAWCEAIKYWDEQINEFSDQPPCSKAKQ